jgi:hypothetical protein
MKKKYLINSVLKYIWSVNKVTEIRNNSIDLNVFSFSSFIWIERWNLFDSKKEKKMFYLLKTGEVNESL